MLFPGIPEPLCCLHQSLLVAVALHGAWESHLARDRQWDRGSLAKEKMTWELDWLLIPTRWGGTRGRSHWLQPDQRHRHVCGAVARCGGLLGRPRAVGLCKRVLGAQHRFFFSIPHRPQLGGLVSADAPGWAQLAELARQMGEDLGLHLQWSPACLKAAGTRVALASLVPLVPRRGRGSSEMLHSSFVLLLFSRKKSNSEAVFPVLSLFCQCQSDLLCQIT